MCLSVLLNISALSVDPIIISSIIIIIAPDISDVLSIIQLLYVG